MFDWKRIVEVMFDVAEPHLPLHLRLVARIVKRVLLELLDGPLAGLPLLMTAAPDQVKDLIRTLFDAAAAQLADRPWLAALVTAFGNFLVDNLADRIWDAIFPANTPIAAAGPADTAALEAAVEAAV